MRWFTWFSLHLNIAMLSAWSGGTSKQVGNEKKTPPLLVNKSTRRESQRAMTGATRSISVLSIRLVGLWFVTEITLCFQSWTFFSSNGSTFLFFNGAYKLCVIKLRENCISIKFNWFTLVKERFSSFSTWLSHKTLSHWLEYDMITFKPVLTLHLYIFYLSQYALSKIVIDSDASTVKFAIIVSWQLVHGTKCSKHFFFF